MNIKSLTYNSVTGQDTLNHLNALNKTVSAIQHDHYTLSISYTTDSEAQYDHLTHILDYTSRPRVQHAVRYNTVQPGQVLTPSTTDSPTHPLTCWAPLSMAVCICNVSLSHRLCHCPSHTNEQSQVQSLSSKANPPASKRRTCQAQGSITKEKIIKINPQDVSEI